MEIKSAVFDVLKPEYMEEHEDYSIEVVFDGEQFDTKGLVQIMKVGKSFYVGKSVECRAQYPNW